MYGIIYEALNKTNGKIYVGQTTGSLDKRKAIHYYYAENNGTFYFYKALRKYDKSIWEWKVLGYADCQFGLDALEKSWMWIKDSMAPSGYNTREGGSHGKHTKESCRKMSETREGKKLSEEHRKNIGEAQKGKRRTRKTCQNISKSLKGKYVGAERHNAKAVQCIETGIIYGAIREAARGINIHWSSISAVLNGKQKTAGGFHWEPIKV